MTISELTKVFKEKLSAIYDQREAHSITNWVFEKMLELNPTKLTLERFRLITQEQQANLHKTLERLLQNEPVQYVLGEADFYGMKFFVDSNVLIPRPETEELVAWIVADYKEKPEVNILDIGTGSGCIAIALAKNLAGAKVEGVDVNADALAIAQKNNEAQTAGVNMHLLDILRDNLKPGAYDVVVSNPPYIGVSEGNTLAANVFNFEPHLALFAPKDDDLAFYKAIAAKAIKALKPAGCLYFEINAFKATDVMQLLTETGFKSIEVRKDLSGKERMIKAVLPA